MSNSTTLTHVMQAEGMIDILSLSHLLHAHDQVYQDYIYYQYDAVK